MLYGWASQYLGCEDERGQVLADLEDEQGQVLADLEDEWGQVLADLFLVSRHVSRRRLLRGRRAPRAEA